MDWTELMSRRGGEGGGGVIYTKGNPHGVGRAIVISQCKALHVQTIGCQGRRPRGGQQVPRALG